MKRLFLALLVLSKLILSDQSIATLVSDELYFSESTRTLYASSNVTLRLNDIVITAPHLELDVDAQEAWATGNIEIQRGDERFYSSSLKINLEKEEVELRDIKITIEPPENKGYIYVRTKRLIDKKEVKEGYSGWVTTCENDDPHYALWAQYYRYYPEKRIIMFNVFIRNELLFVPTGLWIPFYYYALGERKVVWNFPTIGKRDSPGWGWFVQNQIDYKYKNNKDSSLLLDWYQNKGMGYGINHNYDLFDNHEGTVYLYNFDFEDETDYQDPQKQNTIIKWEHTYEPDETTQIKASYLNSNVDEKINSSGSDKREERTFSYTYDDLGDKFSVDISDKDNYRQESKTQYLNIKRSYNGFNAYSFSIDKRLNYTTTKEYQTYTGAYNHLFSKNVTLYNTFKLKRNEDWSDAIDIDEQLFNTHTLKYQHDSHVSLEINIDYMQDLDENNVTQDYNSGLINNYFYKLPEIKIDNRNREFLGFKSNQQFKIARYQEARYDSSTGKRRIYPSNSEFSVAPNTLYMNQSLDRSVPNLPFNGVVSFKSTYEQYTFIVPGESAFAGDAAYKLSFTSSYAAQFLSFIKTTTSYNSAYSPLENNSPFYEFDRSLQSEANSIRQKITLYYKSESAYRWDNEAGYNYINDEWNDYRTTLFIQPTQNYSLHINTGKRIDPDPGFEYNTRWDDLRVTNKVQNIGNHFNLTHYISIDLNKYIDDHYTYIQNSYVDWNFYLGQNPDYRWEVGVKQYYNTRNQNETTPFELRRYELRSLYIMKREHRRTLEMSYTRSTEQWDIVYTILAFPDDPIEIRKRKDLWTLEGRLTGETQERFE